MRKLEGKTFENSGLSKREKDLVSIINTMSVGLIVVDTNLELQFVNPTAYAMFGKNPEFKGEGLYSIVRSPELAERVLCVSEEIVVVTQSVAGDIKDFEFRISPLEKEDGHEQRVILIVNERLTGEVKQFTTPELEKERIKAKLAQALQRNEFYLVYQPQIDMRTGVIIGVEALLRWKTVDNEYFAPDEFITIAEETGHIGAIGEWVLREACRQSRAWIDSGLKPIKISVNLSPKQFEYGNVVEMVQSALSDTGCDPSCIALEITESAVMENPGKAINLLRKISEMGIHISIDDFGVGHSSLAYLKMFSADTLKIDRYFVADVDSSPQDAAIVRTVISLAHALKMKVVAEGVETMAQMQFLMDEKCDTMQGFLYSMSVSPEQIGVMLAEGSGYSLIQNPSTSEANRLSS
jgi:EAL domain-containing protein (putative c-di-GMP-specific phosphodiesterase class I)